MADSLKLIKNALVAQGVQQCYGITGFPVNELAEVLHAGGISFYGFRNEQAAAYAAGAEGYLTGRPGVCLTVSGPGFTNALTGAMNAKENSWPMVLLSGSSETWSCGMGSFQEFTQSESTLSFFKWSVRITNLSMIPRVIHQAFSIAINGRPGPVYIDLPANILRLTSETPVSIEYPMATRTICQANPDTVQRAAEALKTARCPLVIVGKGAAYSRAEEVVNRFIAQCKLPFLATPMGKGVVSDLSPLSVNAARTPALKNADLIILLGARLNWILHYGLPPRFRQDLKLINVNLEAEGLHTNVPAEFPLQGDVGLVVSQLLGHLQGWSYSNSEWWQLLQKQITHNNGSLQKMLSEPSFNYYHALTTINNALPQQAVLICEGANTMDIARTLVHSTLPRRRLDAGSWGTMGAAIPACFAARLVHKHEPVVGIVGDSSLGFSAMELDTCARYLDDLTIFVINNNGVFMGSDSLPEDNREKRPHQLNPGARYELLAEAFGGKGFVAESASQLSEVLSRVFTEKGLKLVNVKIDPFSGKMPQSNFWLSLSDPKL